MKKFIFVIFPLLAFALMPVSIQADTVDEVVEAAKKAPKNQALNREAGDALKDAGRYREAITYYMKGGNSGNLGAAESAFYLYDFDAAGEYLDKYLAKRSKAEAERDGRYMDSNGEFSDWTDFLSERISIGRSMLDRVENIEIIDSINVPVDGFFNFIRLARSAGSLADVESIEKIVGNKEMESLGVDDISQPAFVTERGDEMIWIGAGRDGRSVMLESSRLADGSWDEPMRLFDYKDIFNSSDGSWIDYPFLMNDGVTLYFASDGGESLGQLDIFMTRRDDNKFLQPSNIGMPYNSPYNDYLYAVDEETGTGWWVSDRSRLMDSVTIYTFIPKEIRENYPVDHPDLTARARVTSIKDTWQPGKDYARLRRAIASVDERRRESGEPSFDFQLPDGRVLHRLSDFHSTMARKTMRSYLDELHESGLMKDRLASLRAAYAKGDRSQSTEILRLEKNLEKSFSTLQSLANEVITLEM